MSTFKISQQFNTDRLLIIKKLACLPRVAEPGGLMDLVSLPIFSAGDRPPLFF